MTLLMGAMLLLAPTVGPWYVYWLAPLLCFCPLSAGLLFSATVVLSYPYYWGGQERCWVQVAEYAPVYAALLWSYCATKFARSGRC